MKTLAFTLGILLLNTLCFGDTIYTWTDKDGVVHITDKQPPPGAAIDHQLEYETREPPPKPTTTDVGTEVPSTKEQLSENAAQQRATAARQKADAAWKRADEAMEEALKIKKEADEYVSKVIHKSRKQKSLRVKIQKKVDAANQVMVEAETLRTAALAADQAAKVAEREVEMLKKPREPVPEKEAPIPSVE